MQSVTSKRVSDMSCDSDHFNKATPDYNTALKKSGFDENVKYQANRNKEIERSKQFGLTLLIV